MKCFSFKVFFSPWIKKETNNSLRPYWEFYESFRQNHNWEIEGFERAWIMDYKIEHIWINIEKFQKNSGADHLLVENVPDSVRTILIAIQRNHL